MKIQALTEYLKNHNASFSVQSYIDDDGIEYEAWLEKHHDVGGIVEQILVVYSEESIQDALELLAQALLARQAKSDSE